MTGQRQNYSRRRLTRCRTGCVRCRIRRRKCDEGKPRCRNCVTHNFQCQYKSQLVFLTKNTHTVSPSEDGYKDTANYGPIHFINEDPQNDASQYGEELNPELFVVGATHRTKSHTLPVSRHQRNQSSSHESPESNALGTQMSPVASDLPLSPGHPPSHATGSQPPERFNASDESVVAAGLLALGTDRSNAAAIDPGLGQSGVAVSPPLAEQASYAQAPTPSVFSGHRTSFSPKELGGIADSGSTTAMFELLCHYRYKVAPWLDVCDLGQVFGINALRLAMTSRPVTASMLALSETSLKKLHPMQSSIQENLATQHSRPNGSFDISAFALLTAFDEAKNYLKKISAAWSLYGGFNREVLDAVFVHAAGRDLESAIYWLLVRFDVGAALANHTNIQVPLPPSLPPVAVDDSVTDPFKMVFHFAHRPLWLCARALQFIHSEGAWLERTPLLTWMELVDELERWYHERPQEFQPMLELEMDDRLTGPEHGFPLILFASGPGLFGNQLYHTAMLVLLQSRPRTARTTNFHPTTMSPLWHGQRICGIALHNDRQEHWDPCLMASFLMAAYRMTHETQQQEILRGLERIRSLTGFDIGERLQELRQEWCLLAETWEG